MRFFKLFNSKKQYAFKLDAENREWVEQNMLWLIENASPLMNIDDQILWSATSFPRSFASEHPTAESLIYDFCDLFQLPHTQVSHNWHTDVRDLHQVPFEIIGVIREMYVEITSDKCVIHLANSLHNQPDILISEIIQAFIRIYLAKLEPPIFQEKDDVPFICLAGVHLGLGVIIARQLYSYKYHNNGEWERNSIYQVDMPQTLLIYALVCYAKIHASNEPTWKSALREEIQQQWDAAIEFYNTRPNAIEATSTKVHMLISKSYHASNLNQFKNAIDLLQPIFTLTNDSLDLALAFNNIGYYHIRLGQFSDSIPNFENAISLDPAYGYAYDNLGYVHLILGQLDEGKKLLEKAQMTSTNAKEYTYRNLGLYHFLKGEYAQAEEHYQLAYAEKKLPVDLLEYHYAELLLATGRKDLAMIELQKAVDRREPEAILKMNELR
jgi:tetratricopeptide (TPR) repeat protein